MDTKKKLMAGIFGGAIVVMVAVLIAINFGGGNTISGRLTVTTTEITPGGGDCTVDAGYGDIHEGTQVTVYDNAGKVIGTGKLGAGQGDPSQSPMMQCAFPYTVSGVPSADFYQVEVGSRGKVTLSSKEATSGAADIGITG